MKITREQYLEQQRKASEALLARLMAEVEEALSTEQEAAQTAQPVEYVPDGGGEKRRTRSSAWLVDLE